MYFPYFRETYELLLLSDRIHFTKKARLIVYKDAPALKQKCRVQRTSLLLWIWTSWIDDQFTNAAENGAILF